MRLDLRLLVEQFANSLRRSDCLLNLTVEIGKLAHRSGNKRRVKNEAGKLSHCDLALLQQARTKPKDEHNDPEEREDNKRDKCGAITCASQHKLKEILDALPIAFDFVTLIGESLHIR